jgi:hypothetical protein
VIVDLDQLLIAVMASLHAALSVRRVAKPGSHSLRRAPFCSAFSQQPAPNNLRQQADLQTSPNRIHERPNVGKMRLLVEGYSKVRMSQNVTPLPSLTKQDIDAVPQSDQRCHLVSQPGDEESTRISYPLNSVCAVVLLSLAVPAAAHAEPCRTQALSGACYLVCSFDLTKANLRTYWRGDDGKPHRTFAALAEGLERTGRSLRFAMNGGMYGSDFRPVGLYIENGRELAPANTTTLTGAPSLYRTSTKNRMGFSTWGTTKRRVSPWCLREREPCSPR